MKPQILVTPKKGKLLGAQDNAGFVDTFDWMKNVCNNFKGDGATIEVDRADEDVPVIRLSDGIMRTLENIEENGGGGGECDCDITPYYSEGSDNAHIATWTNGTETKEIYAPTNDNNVIEIYGYISNTPFWLDKIQKKIVKCYFYDGRKLVLTIPDYDLETTSAGLLKNGTYFLKIVTDDYGNRSYSIYFDELATSLGFNFPNSDTTTYYKLWTINRASFGIFDWRGAMKLPFYTE